MKKKLLSELSKKTLSDYVHKASTDREDLTRKMERRRGEFPDRRHELVSKIWNRRHGTNKALHRLTKEDEEMKKPLNELSKKTLGSYVNKATNSAATAWGDYHRSRSEQDKIHQATNTNNLHHLTKDTIRKAVDAEANQIQTKSLRTTQRRIKGVEKAVGRLTKEQQLRTLWDVIAETPSVVKPETESGRRFWKFHKVRRTEDPSGNGDEIRRGKGEDGPGLPTHGTDGGPPGQDATSQVMEARQHGDDVVIHDPHSFNGAFHKKTGSIVGKEGKQYRVKLHDPVHIHGVGHVTDDLWDPSYLKTRGVRKEAHAYHAEDAEQLDEKVFGSDRYEWRTYSHSKPHQLYYRGKPSAELKKGDTFGVRHATSNPGMHRVIVPHMGTSKVHSVDAHERFNLDKKSQYNNAVHSVMRLRREGEEINERDRTSSYAFTTDNSPQGDARVGKLRTMAKLHNIAHKEFAKAEISTGNHKTFPVRVKVRPRLGKDSPNAARYRRGGDLHRATSQDIRPEHGARRDVYVHNRYEDVEQVNEISSDLAKRYLKKANPSYDELADRTFIGGKRYDDWRKGKVGKNNDARRRGNRVAGIDRASHRLGSKSRFEDVEQVNELRSISKSFTPKQVETHRQVANQEMKKREHLIARRQQLLDVKKKMQSFAFRGARGGDPTVVKSSSEGAARNRAMHRRWGDPKPLSHEEPRSAFHPRDDQPKKYTTIGDKKKGYAGLGLTHAHESEQLDERQRDHRKEAIQKKIRQAMKNGDRASLRYHRQLLKQEYKG